MIVRFNKVKLHNFLSFGDSTIALDTVGYTMVSGCNLCKTDHSKSNGSGKSSIWEAITYALTGDTVRGTHDIVNTAASDGAYVELEFSIDNVPYKILRSKDSAEYKTSLRFWVNGVEKSGKGIRDTEKILAQYLGELNASLLGSVIILGQGLPQRFSNNTPAGRKEVLETLSKSDYMIEDLKARISSRKTELSKKSDEMEKTLSNLEGKLSVLDCKLLDWEGDYDALEDADVLQSKIDTLNKSLAETTEKKQKLSEEIEALEAKVQHYREEYLILNAKQSEESRDDEEEKNNHLTPLTQRKSDLEAKIALFKSEVEKIKNIKDICPTCGQKIPNVHKPSTSDQEAEIEALSYTLCGVLGEIENVKMLYQCRSDDRQKRYGIKKSEVEELAKAEKSIITQKKSDEEKLSALIKSDESRLTSLTYDLKVLEDRKKQLLSQISSAKNDIEMLVQKRNECYVQLSEIQKHIEVVNKFETVIRRDFRGMLLKNVIEYIDCKAKEYSKEVFNTDLISFTLDGNNIMIAYSNKPYENLSGGERQKIDIIIQMAIRDMLCKFLNFSSNILVIDECFDNLDSIGCQKIMDLISNRLRDVESIYVITHHTDINIPYDNEIVVVKNEEGVSSIE